MATSHNYLAAFYALLHLSKVAAVSLSAFLVTGSAVVTATSNVSPKTGKKIGKKVEHFIDYTEKVGAAIQNKSTYNCPPIKGPEANATKLSASTTSKHHRGSRHIAEPRKIRKHVIVPHEQEQQKPLTELEQRQTIGQAEGQNWPQFINDGGLRSDVKVFRKDRVVGVITSSAHIATYMDLVLHLQYFSRKGVLLFEEDVVLDKVLRPNDSITIDHRVDSPAHTHLIVPNITQADYVIK